MQPDELALQPAPRAARAGDWFEAVFRRHYPRLVALVARLTGDRSLAEEIAADAFAKLARRSFLLDGDSAMTAWVYRVGMNAGVDALRANSRRKKTEEAAGLEQLRIGSTEGALDAMLRREREARVRTILSGMKPRDTQLLLLRSEGLSYREIAQTLGLQANSVGTLLARAEREFERRYRARFGDAV